MKWISDSAFSLVVFIAVFAIHAQSNVAPFTDSRWVSYTSMNLIKKGDVNLDTYAAVKLPDDDRLVMVNGHLRSRYPIGTAILILPLVFIIDTFWHHCYGVSLEEYLKVTTPLPGTLLPTIEVIIASCIAGMSAVVIYRIARVFLDKKFSLLLAFIFAFCTPAWSTASRSLWPHGPSMLVLSLVLYLLIRAQDKFWPVALANLLLVFACIIRPTNFISLFFIFIYEASTNKKYRVFFLFSLLTIIWLVYSYYFSLIQYAPPYQKALKYFYLTKENGLCLESLIGNLFSPARGLLVFTPIFLFSFYGILVKIKNRQLTRLDITLLLILFFHWLAISRIRKSWWGGHSFGPRYFTELSPYFVFFLIPAIKEMFALKNAKRIIIRNLFFACVIASLFIHYKGATDWSTWAWNYLPVNVDAFPSRLWDWHDPQFLR